MPSLSTTPVAIAAGQKLTNTGSNLILFDRQANPSPSRHIGHIAPGTSFTAIDDIYIVASLGDTTYASAPTIAAPVGNTELAYAQINSPVQALASAVIDLGLSITFTIDGSRPFNVSLDAPYVYHSAVGGVNRLEIVRTDTSQVVQQGTHQSAIATGIGNIHIERRQSLPAGTYTYKGQLRNGSGSGNANVFASDDAGTQNAGNAIVPSLKAVLL